MWVAGNKRWTIIENVRFINRTVFNRLFKSFVLFPPFNNGFLIFDSLAALSSSIFHRDIVSFFGVDVELVVWEKNLVRSEHRDNDAK